MGFDMFNFGGSEDTPEHRIRREIDYIHDECIDCGEDNIVGIAIIKEVKSNGGYVQEWRHHRCPICEDNNEELVEDALIENLVKVNTLPQYTLMWDDRTNSFLIRDPLDGSRRVYGSYEKGSQRCKDILERETPDTNFKSVWVNAEDTRTFGVGLHIDGNSEFFWKDKENHRIPSMYDDIHGPKPDEHITVFEVLDDCEWVGETIRSVRTDIEVPTPYSHKVSKHSSFETDDDHIVGFVPGKCPVCETKHPTQLYAHKTADGQYLIEHRKSGCNKIIGIPNPDIFYIDSSDSQETFPDESFDVGDVEDQVADIDDTDLDILDADI